MAIDFNHTIVPGRDSQKSETFLADILGLSAPKRWGPFLMVTADNGANIDFMNPDGEITPFRRHRHTPIVCHGDREQTNCTSLPLAEWL